MLKNLIWFIFLGCSQLAIANNCIPNPILFFHLSTLNGLLSNDVRTITQDSEGYWWIGTDNGLQRYDGQNFINFRHEEGNPASLPSDRIFSVFSDTRGRVWVATVKGLCRYLPEKGTFLGYELKANKNLLDFPVRIFEDLSGHLWLSHFNANRLYRLRSNGTVWETVNLPEGVTTFGAVGQNKQTGEIISTFRNANGTIFTGIIKDNRNHFGLLPVNLHPRLTAMQDFVVDDNNNLFGTQVMANEHRDDIIRVNLTDRSSYIYPAYNAKTPLHLGKDGRVWFFSMLRGVYGFLKGNSVTNYCWPERSLDPKPITASIENTFEDKEGNIWLLTNNGLYVFNPYQPGITKIKELEGKTGNVKISEVLSLYQSSNQQIWIGTYFKGTYLLDRNLRLKERFYLNLPENYREPSRTSLINFNSLWVFHEDKSGNIWAGGQLGVLLKFSPDGKLMWKQPGQYFNYQTIRSMAEDKNGNLWMGTHGGLLFKFNPIDLISELVLDRSSKEMGKHRLFQIIPENEERFWLVYADKLICWDAKSNRPVRPVTQPIKNNSVELKDEIIKGAISWNKDSLFVYGFYPYWFDKNTQTYTKIEGFSKLPRDEIMFAFKHKDDLWLDQKGLLVNWKVKNQQVITYDAFDGWASDPLELNNTATQLSDGRIIASLYREGLGVFNPGEMENKNRIPPSILINSIQTKNRNILLPSNKEKVYQLKLPYDENDLTIHYACPTWIQRHHLQFSYTFRMKENNWINNGNKRSINLAGLSPGQYHLYIKATNKLGLSTEKPAVISIKILPPWYMSLPAWLVYFFISIYLGYQLYQFLLGRKLVLAEIAKIKEMDAFKSSFYTNITHEFRTPLTIIQGMAGQIKSEPDKYLHTGVEMILRNGERLLQLINQILDLSKLDAGQLKFSPQTGNIISFLHYFLENYHWMAQSKGIDFSFSSDTDALIMDFDAEMIQQSLGNLISNALKYSNKGGRVVVNLKIKESEIMSFVDISVTDEGNGIQKKNMERIFDRFFQEEYKGSGVGSGIGLSLSRELARIMGGDISVESEVGRGSVFTLSLPVSRANNAPFYADEVELKVEESEKNLLLLIEDNHEVLFYLKSCLEPAYRILSANDGLEGLKKATNFIPDLIISDIMMPKMDGLTFGKKLREDIQTSHIPLIYLTAQSGNVKRMDGFEAGADEYLTKPFHKEELLLRVKQLLEQRKRLQHHYLLQSLKEKDFVTSPHPASLQDTKFLEELRDSVEKKMSDPLFNASDLEQMMKMSHSRFYRKMMAVVGISGNTYIRKIRIQKAKELLTQSLLSISEIAFQTGFNDPSYFSKVFREETGENPADWRKEMG